MHVKTGNLGNFVYAKNRTSVNKNLILRPLKNRYFWNLTFSNLSPNCTRNPQNFFFKLFCFWAHFRLKFPLYLKLGFPVGRSLAFKLKSVVNYEYTHWHPKNIGQCIGVIFTKIYTPYYMYYVYWNVRVSKAWN